MGLFMGSVFCFIDPYVCSYVNTTLLSFLNFYLSIYLLFLAVLDLYCFIQAFSSCNEQGLLFIAVHRFLIAVASRCRAQGLDVRTSVVVVHVFSCSKPCGVFPDQESNPYPLHWQVDS